MEKCFKNKVGITYDASAILHDSVEKEVDYHLYVRAFVLPFHHLLGYRERASYWQVGTKSSQYIYIYRERERERERAR